VELSSQDLRRAIGLAFQEFEHRLEDWPLHSGRTALMVGSGVWLGGWRRRLQQAGAGMAGLSRALQIWSAPGSSDLLGQALSGVRRVPSRTRPGQAKLPPGSTPSRGQDTFQDSNRKCLALFSKREDVVELQAPGDWGRAMLGGAWLWPEQRGDHEADVGSRERHVAREGHRGEGWARLARAK